MVRPMQTSGSNTASSLSSSQKSWFENIQATFTKMSLGKKVTSIVITIIVFLVVMYIVSYAFGFVGIDKKTSFNPLSYLIKRMSWIISVYLTYALHCNYKNEIKAINSKLSNDHKYLAIFTILAIYLIVLVVLKLFLGHMMKHFYWAIVITIAVILHFIYKIKRVAIVIMILIAITFYFLPSVTQFMNSVKHDKKSETASTTPVTSHAKDDSLISDVISAVTETIDITEKKINKVVKKTKVDSDDIAEIIADKFLGLVTSTIKSASCPEIPARVLIKKASERFNETKDYLFNQPLKKSNAKFIKSVTFIKAFNSYELAKSKNDLKGIKNAFEIMKNEKEKAK